MDCPADIVATQRMATTLGEFRLGDAVAILERTPVYTDATGPWNAYLSVLRDRRP